MARKKVAVLGGGVGAMTTAFYLTSFPGWRERYDLSGWWTQHVTAVLRQDIAQPLDGFR